MAELQVEGEQLSLQEDVVEGKLREIGRSGVASAPVPSAAVPPPYTRQASLDQPFARAPVPMAPYTGPPPPIQRQFSDPVHYPLQQPYAYSPPQQQQQYWQPYSPPPPQQLSYQPQYIPASVVAGPAPRVVTIPSLPKPQYVSPSKPTGYNIIDLFKTGNQIQLIPVNGNRPLKIDWGKLSGGGGFTDPSSMFEVTLVDEPGTTAFTLKNQEKKKFISLTENTSLISLSERVQIKLKTAEDDDCKFNARPVGSVESAVICLESAAHPGLYLGNYPNGNTTVSSEPVTRAFGKQAHYKVRATKVVHKLDPSRPLQSYGRKSMLQNVYDRCTIQLCDNKSRQYMGINRKGAIIQTGDRSTVDIFFVVIDRGMGVVSLRSWKHAGHYLRTTSGGVLIGKGHPNGLDGDFQMQQSYDNSICFFPVNFPARRMAPPGFSCDFILTVVETPSQAAS